MKESLKKFEKTQKVSLQKSVVIDNPGANLMKAARDYVFEDVARKRVGCLDVIMMTEAAIRAKVRLTKGEERLYRLCKSAVRRGATELVFQYFCGNLPYKPHTTGLIEVKKERNGETFLDEIPLLGEIAADGSWQPPYRKVP